MAGKYGACNNNPVDSHESGTEGALEISHITTEQIGTQIKAFLASSLSQQLSDLTKQMPTVTSKTPVPNNSMASSEMFLFTTGN